MQQKPNEPLKPKIFTIRLSRMNLARAGVSYAESAQILEPLGLVSGASLSSSMKQGESARCGGGLTGLLELNEMKNRKHLTSSRLLWRYWGRKFLALGQASRPSGHESPGSRPLAAPAPRSEFPLAGGEGPASRPVRCILPAAAQPPSRPHSC